MRLSVIFDDELVMKDGVGYRVTLPNEPDVHAIQWTGATGEIEYRDQHTPNEAFDDEAVLAPYLALWQAAHDAAIAPPSGPAPLPAEVPMHKVIKAALITPWPGHDSLDAAIRATFAALPYPQNRLALAEYDRAANFVTSGVTTQNTKAALGMTEAQFRDLVLTAVAMA